jgi:hypothetical protein
MPFDVPFRAYILSWSGMLHVRVYMFHAWHPMIMTNANDILNPTTSMAVYNLFLDRNLR